MKGNAPGYIVNKLDYWIKRRGYKKYEVVEATQIPVRTLNDYCRGRTAVPRDRLEALAAFLECSISALLDERETTHNGTTSHELNTVSVTHKTASRERDEGYQAAAQVASEPAVRYNISIP